MHSSPEARARAGFVPTAAVAGAGVPRPAPVLRGDTTPAGERARAHAAGWAAGRSEALLVVALEEQQRGRAHEECRDRESSRADAARERALSALQQAAQDRATEDAELAAQVVGLVLGLAGELAGAIVGAAAPRERARAAVDRALAAAGDDDATLLVRLHPQDVDALGGVASVPGAELRPDPSLRLGDAVASRGAQRLDARVRETIERALAALAEPGTTGGPGGSR